MKRYRVLLVGAGAVGYGVARLHPASHFAVFHRHPRFRVVGVVETSAARRRLVEQRHRVPVFAHVRTARALDPDLVVVATPDDTHTAVLREVVEWSPRLVFCEKPVAARSVDVRSLALTYAGRGVPLAVNYTRRFLPALRAMALSLASGRWGLPRVAIATYSRGLVHNGVHLLDLLMWWFGPPRRVLARQPHPVLAWPGGFQVHFVEVPGERMACNELDLHLQRGRVRLTAERRLREARLIRHPDAPHLQCYGRESVRTLAYDRALSEAARTLAAYLDGRRALPTPVADSVPLHSWLDRMKEKS